jgi:hyperosmotically inducible periplasmic protein
MKTQLSILAVCLAAGCAHGKANTETAHSERSRDERAATVIERSEAPVAARTPESPSDADSESESESERVDVPQARRRDEIASAGGTLPAPRAGQSDSEGASESGTDADNTRVNERDRDSAALTPLDQKENKTDREITQQIRKAVIADDALSFTAKNVKIITRDGQVTLRGAVKSAEERSAIERAATGVAGPQRVVNQLEVAKD